MELLKPFPACVSRAQFVPELNIFLVLFPAQKNLAPANNRREIN
jgi:hypothetical protein